MARYSLAGGRGWLRIGGCRWPSGAAGLFSGRPRGITAIELLILVVLVVILTAFAIPSMSPVVLNLRLRGAAWQVGGDLRLARQRAVTIRKRFRICLTGCAISLPAGSYSLERDDGTPTTPQWVSETGAPVRLPPDVTLTATATPVFRQNGMASGSTLTVSNVMGSYQVVVASTGRVRVCQGSC
jgi:Tfp pilus assembly protein FimT